MLKASRILVAGTSKNENAYLKEVVDLKDEDTEYIRSAFREQRIKLGQLSTLTDAELEQIGLTQLGFREAVLSVIETLK